MKFQAVLFAAAAVFGLAAAYDEVTECPATEFVKLAPLAANPNLNTCQAASEGWQMLPPVGYPTDTQRAAMCLEPTCFNLIDAIKALNPSDCMLVFGDVKLNVKKLAEEFEGSCF
jgi:hypothetical protein|uniref:Elicitin n=1 Tax=Globisporangium ultimum (strain ATCC 200006 / CBS 805.95 / DAOM BR144) TaxID=431595 RepID=K3WWP3_GLOUD